MPNLQNALWTSLDKMRRMPTDVKSTTSGTDSRNGRAAVLRSPNIGGAAAPPYQKIKFSAPLHLCG